MRLSVVAVAKGTLNGLFPALAESFHECFGQCPVVGEIEGGGVRAVLEMEIPEAGRGSFLEKYLSLRMRILGRAPGTKPETKWFDLDETPTEVLATRTLTI